MLCKIIICLLITYRFELVHGKAWPDQYNRYDYSNPSNSWGNPYYNNRGNFGEFGSEPTTSTTTKPLYPTLFPKYQPSAPFPDPSRVGMSNPVPNNRQYDDDTQRQVPVNPFNVLPLQPNVGGNHDINHGQNNRNNYSDNNFNYPFDNTRTPFPPFDGSTKRPTFPTRRPFSNVPTPVSNLNSSHSVIPNQSNSSNPNQNNYNVNPNHYNRDRYNPTPSNGNFNQNVNNGGSSAYRPFPSASELNKQQPNVVNPYRGTNYQPTNINQNQPNNPFSHGNQYPIQPNTQSNIGNQGINKNTNSAITSQNSYNQPQMRPDYDPNGIALAPFPDVSHLNSYNNGHKSLNSETLQLRQSPIQPDVNSRFNADGSSQIPLAGYTGAHVPLA